MFILYYVHTYTYIYIYIYTCIANELGTALTNLHTSDRRSLLTSKNDPHMKTILKQGYLFSIILTRLNYTDLKTKSQLVTPKLLLTNLIQFILQTIPFLNYITCIESYKKTNKKRNRKEILKQSGMFISIYMIY